MQRRHAQHLKSVRARQQKAQCQRDELHAFRSCAVRQQSHQHALHMHVTTLNLHLNVLRSCADRISTGGTQMATAALKLTMSALHLRSCQALMFAQMTSLSGKPMKPGMASRGGTPAAMCTSNCCWHELLDGLGPITLHDGLADSHLCGAHCTGGLPLRPCHQRASRSKISLGRPRRRSCCSRWQLHCGGHHPPCRLVSHRRTHGRALTRR